MLLYQALTLLGDILPSCPFLFQPGLPLLQLVYPRLLLLYQALTLLGDILPSCPFLFQPGLPLLQLARPGLVFLHHSLTFLGDVLPGRPLLFPPLLALIRLSNPGRVLRGHALALLAFFENHNRYVFSLGHDLPHEQPELSSDKWTTHTLLSLADELVRLVQI